MSPYDVLVRVHWITQPPLRFYGASTTPVFFYRSDRELRIRLSSSVEYQRNTGLVVDGTLKVLPPARGFRLVTDDTPVGAP